MLCYDNFSLKTVCKQIIYDVDKYILKSTYIILSMSREGRDSVNDSFVSPDQQQSGILRWLQKFDFFSFIPVPKDQPVSTKRSIIGSCIFIILFLTYIGVDLYQFISSNPPIVQNAQSKLDDEWYQMPRVAIAFMKGEYLNQTQDFNKSITFQMSKQLKDNSIKQSSPITLDTNNRTYLQDWLGQKTLNFYSRLLSPAEPMKAKGLLYSTSNSNYTKITIRLCNINKNQSLCNPLNDISSLMAKGRIFLFVEQIQDQSGVSRKQNNPNKFRIANFFLMPRLYKRVIVEFQVVKTIEYPDYFRRWFTKEYTRLELYEISEQSSDTSKNDEQLARYPIQMLGITFQLAAQTLNVRVNYTTLLDHVAKWGAFFNVLFAVFALFFLAYNKDKFYKKNPDWDRFKQRKRSALLNESDTKLQIPIPQQQQKMH